MLGISARKIQYRMKEYAQLDRQHQADGQQQAPPAA
jgi:hypothetical protein